MKKQTRATKSRSVLVQIPAELSRTKGAEILKSTMLVCADMAKQGIQPLIVVLPGTHVAPSLALLSAAGFDRNEPTASVLRLIAGAAWGTDSEKVLILSGIGQIAALSVPGCRGVRLVGNGRLMLHFDNGNLDVEVPTFSAPKPGNEEVIAWAESLEVAPELREVPNFRPLMAALFDANGMEPREVASWAEKNECADSVSAMGAAMTRGLVTLKGEAWTVTSAGLAYLKETEVPDDVG